LARSRPDATANVGVIEGKARIDRLVFWNLAAQERINRAVGR
jgi:hypothetical protein